MTLHGAHPTQAPHKPRTYLWKFQVKRRVMSAVPLYSSRFIWARLGGLMRHSAPELPSICAVTMSSGLYWLMNCMASWEHGGTSVLCGQATPSPKPSPPLPGRHSVGAAHRVGVKLPGQLLVGLLCEGHNGRLLGTHGEQGLGVETG